MRPPQALPRPPFSETKKGIRFGRLTVLSEQPREYLERRYTIPAHGDRPEKTSYWRELKPLEYLCRCDCGNEKIVKATYLLSGDTRSCGCLRRERMRLRVTHGESKTELYRIWHGLKRRCFDQKDQNWKNYGGRGITVAGEWVSDYRAFADYVKEVLGERPSKKHSLDRIDNNDGYRPGNLRWATAAQQANNTRRNIIVEYRGVTRTVSEWAVELQIPEPQLRYRFNSGWLVEEALTTPANLPRKNWDTVTYLGEVKSLANWAQQLGIPYAVLLRRLNKNNWSIEEALSTPLRKQVKIRRLTWKGETKTLSEWARVIGCETRTLRSRVDAGWPVEKVLGKPITAQQQPNKLIEFD